MKEILPGIRLIEQNGGKGFGYTHFVVRAAGNHVDVTSRWLQQRRCHIDVTGSKRAENNPHGSGREC